MTELPISWDPVKDFLYRVLGGRTTSIIAGTPEWIALDDDDPQKSTALMVAGSRWCLEEEIAQIRERRHAIKDAAIAVAEARAWASVARFIRDRDRFYREHPDLKRKVH